ncbi:MAG: T9SS type A sorting domain-containing protein [Bacteroidota bacterium]
MKISKLLFTCLLLPALTFAQDIGAITHNLNNGTYNTGGSAVLDRGVVFTFRTHAVGTQTRNFLWHTGIGNYATKWATNTTTSFAANTIHSGGAVLNGSLDLPMDVTDQYYYTFIVQKGNTSGNKDFSVLETSFDPVTISSVSFSPASPNSAQSETVSVTLSSTKNVDEHLFIRWTVDNFTTSHFTEITSFSGNVGTAVITPQSAGTTVQFYALTTTQLSPAASSIDYFTLEFENNANANYSYAVTDNGTTTFNTPTINAGTPAANGFRANELFESVTGTDFYVTWDAQNLYVAFSGACNSTTDRFNIAIDTDPDGSSGTTVPFSGVRFPLGGQLPDYAVQVIGLGSAALYKNSDGSWNAAAASGFGQYGDGSNGSNMKVKIPFSALQGASGTSAYNPSNPIRIIMWISGASQDKPYRVAPGSNSQGDLATIITALRSYYLSAMPAAVAPAASTSDLALTAMPTTFQINLASSVGSVNDNNNLLGTAASAVDGYDSEFDLPEPPAAPGNYIQLLFPHPEFVSILGDDFTNDIRADFPPSEANASWGFQVNTNVANSTVTITIEPDGRIPSNVGIFLRDSAADAGTLINMKSADFIYSYNSGASPGTRSFALVLLDTLTLDVTLLSPNGGEIFRSGSTQTISYIRTGAAETDSVIFSFSSDNGETYSPVAIVQGNAENYSWTVPQHYYTTQGKIRVILTDELSNSDTAYSASPFTIVGDSLSVALPQGWNLFGSPLSGSYSSLAPQLSGGAGFLFAYTPTSGYTASTGLTDGTGYWLGLQNAGQYFVKGVAFSGEDSVVLPLQQGFNLISDPFVLPLQRDALLFTKAGARATFPDAVSNGWIASLLYEYFSGSYTSADTVGLFTGYWIGVLQSGVSIVFHASSASTPSASPSREPLLAPKSGTDDFFMQISAQFNGAKDDLLRFGVQSTASDVYDPLDAPKPPRSPASEFVETYFLHPEWQLPFGDRIAYDISNSGSIWNFTVSTSSAGPVTLRWNAEGIATERSLSLKDMTTGQSLSMKTVASYSYTSAAERQFQITSILAGTKGNGLSIPTVTSLDACYPNPFNPSTAIQYSIAQSGHVSLTVFDMLGRAVTELVNAEQSAGIRTVLFDATHLPSGIYFYTLRTDNFSATRKMVLIK